jgi:hypothetical protein
VLRYLIQPYIKIFTSIIVNTFSFSLYVTPLAIFYIYLYIPFYTYLVTLSSRAFYFTHFFPFFFIFLNSLYLLNSPVFTSLFLLYSLSSYPLILSPLAITISLITLTFPLILALRYNYCL